MTTHVPSPARPTVLRRTRSGRAAAGVCSGLGTYFGLDPVLFRVLFATSAFFGGAGILAYLLAWAVIPDEGAERAAVDGWVGALRRRRVPVWLVAVVGGLVLWAAAASWWTPGPPLAGIALVGVAVAVLVSRRQVRAAADPAGPEVTGPEVADPEAPTAVQLAKPGGAAAATHAGLPLGDDLRAWVRESRAAGRERARRNLPVRVATLVTLVLALTVIAAIDAARGVEFQAYFWTASGVLLLGLLTGVVLRRAAWSIVLLLIPALAGTLAFAGSTTRLGDGTGNRTWTPTAGDTARYRLAFGSAELDLRPLAGTTSPTRIDVTVGAGDVRIRVPRGLRVTVDAHVHIGRVEISRPGATGAVRGEGGMGTHQVVRPPAGTTGAPVRVDVHLTDGRVLVDQR